MLEPFLLSCIEVVHLLRTQHTSTKLSTMAKPLEPIQNTFLPKKNAPQVSCFWHGEPLTVLNATTKLILNDQGCHLASIRFNLVSFRKLSKIHRDYFITLQLSLCNIALFVSKSFLEFVNPCIEVEVFLVTKYILWSTLFSKKLLNIRARDPKCKK